MGPNFRVLSGWTSWSIETKTERGWIPLVPVAGNITNLGTNSTGAFASRTARLVGGSYTGVLTTIYEVLSSGPLKWNLEYTSDSTGQFRLVYTWKNIPDSSLLTNQRRQFLAKYSDANYTFGWDDVPQSFNVTTRIEASAFSLIVDLGAITGGSKVRVDPYVVASAVDPRYALKYQRIATQQGAQLRYFLCGGVSQPFEDFLLSKGIFYTKTC